MGLLNDKHQLLFLNVNAAFLDGIILFKFVVWVQFSVRNGICFLLGIFWHVFLILLENWRLEGFLFLFRLIVCMRVQIVEILAWGLFYLLMAVFFILLFILLHALIIINFILKRNDCDLGWVICQCNFMGTIISLWDLVAIIGVCWSRMETVWLCI